MFFNRSFYTLCLKEIIRFSNVPGQTLLAPLVTSLLFLSIFTFALRRSEIIIGGVPFTAFLACGLLSMSVMQNAFANSSASLMHSKILGGLSDVLMAPLNSYEIAAAWVLGGVARGIIVGSVNGLFLLPIASFYYPLDIHYGLLLYYLVFGSIFMSSLGLIAGLYAQKFEHMATMTNFVIMPATFLSGTFYSVADLPVGFRFITDMNTLHYIIDGVRYSIVGYHDSGLLFGAFFVAMSACSVLFLAFFLVKRGWRLIV